MLRALLRFLSVLLIASLTAQSVLAEPQRLRLRRPARPAETLPLAPTAQPQLSREDLAEKQAADEETKQLAIETLASSAITFEENVGQFSEPYAFVANGLTSGAMLRRDALTMSLPIPRTPDAEPTPPGRPDAEPAPREFVFLEMRLEGASKSSRPVGLIPSPMSVNYYRGRAPKDQFEDVRHFGKVRFEGVYPGTDLVYYGVNGALEYDFVVAPGADPGAIEVSFQGADDVRIDAAGDLLLQTPAGEVRQTQPVAYQDVDGERRLVTAAFEPRADGRFGFRLDDYDPARPLVIDPVICYATGLGGPGDDFPSQVVVDAEDNVYISGRTINPVWPAVQQLDLAEEGGPQGAGVFIGFVLFLQAIKPATGPDYLQLAKAAFFGSGLLATIITSLAYHDGTLYAAGSTQGELAGVDNLNPSQGPFAFVAALAAVTLSLIWINAYGTQSEALAIQVITPTNAAAFLAVAVLFKSATFLGVNRGFGEQGAAIMTLGLTGLVLSALAFYLQNANTQMGLSGLQWLLVGTTIYLLAYGAANGPMAMARNSHIGGWDGFVALFTLSALGIISFAGLSHIGTQATDFLFGAQMLLVAGVLHVMVGLISSSPTFLGIENRHPRNGFNVFLALYTLTTFALVSGGVWGIVGAGDIFGAGLAIDRWNNFYCGIQAAAALTAIALVNARGEELDRFSDLRLREPLLRSEVQGASPHFNAGIAKFNIDFASLALSLYYAVVVRSVADMRLVTVVDDFWENPFLLGYVRTPGFPVTDNAVEDEIVGGTDLFLVQIKQPNIFKQSVVDAASFQDGYLIPCQIVTIFGHWIGPKQLALFELDEDGYFPTEVGGTSVYVNGVAQSMIFASRGQLSFILACDIESQPLPQQASPAQLWVEYDGQQSNVVELPLLPAQPALFTVAQSGKGKVAALNQDGSLNSASSPAALGDVVALFGTGGGPTDPFCDTAGLASTTMLQTTLASFTATVGGRPASLVFSGNSPGLTCGLNQWNVTVPAGLTVADANQDPDATTICVRLASGEVIEAAVAIQP